MWLSIFHLLAVISLCSGQTTVGASSGCQFVQIGGGIHLQQDFGETVQKTIVASPDCMSACEAETSFVCTAYLWAPPNGDCVLFDQINMNFQVFKDGGAFNLYTQACNGASPSIGYCQFEITQSNVVLSGQSVSPGMASPSGCQGFCIADYMGVNCTAFTVAPASQLYSTCTLYQTFTSAQVSSGSMDLWTIVCHPAPVNCVYGQWGSWGSCSATCGGGTETQTRPIVTQGGQGGVACDSTQTTNSQSCNTQDCSQDCQYSAWSSWTTCSATCNAGGTQSATRSITAQPTGGGAACDSTTLTQSQSCNTGVTCPVTDCVYSGWSSFGTCSVTCGGGTQTATRTIVSQAMNGGTPCDSTTLTQSQSCNTATCPPVDCTYSSWSSFGTCSVTCGGGTQTATRTIVSQAMNGGTPCDSTTLTQSQSCNTATCPPVDCMYSMWSDWNACTVTCGGGTQTASRTIVSQAMNGGTPCDSTTLTQSQSCNTATCPPVDCMYSMWSDWSACTVTCGSGTQTQTRTIASQPENGGAACDPTTLSESQTCDTGIECPAACVIASVDPMSHPSSKGYKSVGAQSDCNAACLAETSFVCEGYMTTGPGGQCIIFGAVDQHTTVEAVSSWTMYDLQCAVNKTAATTICTYQMVKTNIDPTTTGSGSGKSLQQAVNSTHCETLCENNFPMNHCAAYAFSPNVGFYQGANCYFYGTGSIQDVSSVPTNSSSTYDLYMLVC